MTDEKRAYIDFIAKMLEGCDLRRVKSVYEFILALTS